MSIRNEEAEERSWSNLQVELLDLIMRRLPFFDQLSFRAVCKSWRSTNRLPNQRLWYLILSGMDKYSWHSMKLIDLTSKKSYNVDMSNIRKKNKNLKDPYAMRVHQSKYGWLMISSYHKKIFSTSRSLYLFTPFRNHNNFIELPTWRRSKSFEFATFSTDPLRKDCLFLTAKLVHKNNSLSIKTCRRGDPFWSTHNFKCDLSLPMIVAWTYGEGILYYADWKGRVRGLDITNRQTRGTTVLPEIPTLPEINNRYSYSFEMVNFDGVLFLLLRGSYRVGHVRLYAIDIRLDSSLMTWKQILNEWSLFPAIVYPSITLILGEGGNFRSVMKYREDRQLEKLYEFPRTLFGYDSPFNISFQNCCISRHGSFVYWIEHPLTCNSNS